MKMFAGLIPKELFFPKLKKQDLVALNLGNCYLKGLIIKEGKIVDYFLEPKKNLSEDLKIIWEKKKITTRQLKLSLKSPSCLVRYFPFAKLEKNKMREALSYELNKHIPFPAESVYFDFCILEEKTKEEVNLLLAVVKKDFLDPILETLQKERLEPLEITLDSICLINLFLKLSKNEKKFNASILDIGYSGSTLTILGGRAPLLTRELLFSGRQIINNLMHAKNIPADQLQPWLLSLMQNPVLMQEVLELLADSLPPLLKEIKISFDFFEVNKAQSVERLYLSGALANLSALTSFFKENLNVETEVLGVPPGLEDVFGKEFNSLKNIFSVAIGLSL